MKHGSEKSDARVVAAKSANKSEKSEAESMEPRRATKENMDQTPKSRTQCREIEVSGLERVRQRSKSQPKERMTTLMHHLTVAALWSAYDRLKRNAAPGVDGVTWQEYGEDLIARLTELHQRLQSNRYRPQPSRRVYIAKADLRQRPLGIAALEDKSSKARWWTCSMQSTSRRSRATRTASGLGETRIKHSTRWPTASAACQ